MERISRSEAIADLRLIFAEGNGDLAKNASYEILKFLDHLSDIDWIKDCNFIPRSVFLDPLHVLYVETNIGILEIETAIINYSTSHENTNFVPQFSIRLRNETKYQCVTSDYAVAIFAIQRCPR